MAQIVQHIKISEMARLLSRSVKQFRADIKKYSIPHITLGHTKIFDPVRVVEYLTMPPQLSSPSNEPERKGFNQSLKAKNKSSRLSPADEIERYRKMVGLE